MAPLYGAPEPARLHDLSDKPAPRESSLGAETTTSACPPPGKSARTDGSISAGSDAAPIVPPATPDINRIDNLTMAHAGAGWTRQKQVSIEHGGGVWRTV